MHYHYFSVFVKAVFIMIMGYLHVIKLGFKVSLLLHIQITQGVKWFVVSLCYRQANQSAAIRVKRTDQACIAIPMLIAC